MKKLKILMTFGFSMAILGLFAQVTEQQKRKLNTQKRIIVQPNKKVEYPGVEWKPVEGFQEYPGVEWMPKQDSLYIMKVADETPAGIRKRIQEVKSKKQEAILQVRRIQRRIHNYDFLVRILEDDLAKLEGTTPATNEPTEQTLSDEEIAARRERSRAARDAARRHRVRQAELKRAKDYNELERIVAARGQSIKFRTNSQYISNEDKEKLAFLIEAVNVNGHARLIFGIKKKTAGLANARVKELKQQLASMGLVPNKYNVSKLKKKAKSKNWLSINNHMWMRLEHL